MRIRAANYKPAMGAAGATGTGEETVFIGKSSIISRQVESVIRIHPARRVSELQEGCREMVLRQDVLVREISLWLVFDENRLAGLR
jgi:hypothetical protein